MSSVSLSLCVICCFPSLPAHPSISLSVSVSLSEAFICLALREIFCARMCECAHLREGLCLMNVQSGSTYPSLLQRLCQGLLVHQASPRGIHQERALTHLWRTNTNKSTENNKLKTSYLLTNEKMCVFYVPISSAVKLICLI